eukprot:749963-Hanusia_phi.AAC.1
MEGLTRRGKNRDDFGNAGGWTRSSTIRWHLRLLLLLAVFTRCAVSEENGTATGGNTTAEEEEDEVPGYDQVIDEDAGPFSLKPLKYKVVTNYTDIEAYRLLGLPRLTTISKIRKSFRERAKGYKKELNKCFQCPASAFVLKLNANLKDLNATNATNATARVQQLQEEEEEPWYVKERRIERHKLRMAEFESMTSAYKILNDPDTKRVYEVQGMRGIQGKYKPKFEDPLKDPVNLEMAFKTGSFKIDFGFKEGQQKSTGNVHHNIKIPMIGFYTGFHMDVGIVRGEICPHCNGSGAAENAELLSCPDCKGTGKQTKT